MLAFIPFAVLILLLVCCISVFGNATLDGASQVSLIIASGVSVLVGWCSRRLSWDNLDKEMTAKVASCTPSIIILLLIGAISGTWMVSGIVPTMIYYGLQVLSPQWFLVSTCVICALVSLLIGSSWTTIATVGVALLGIGKAMGFSDGWIAGAIISGAYFGDKLSPLSDTTVLASSVVGTPLFTHIKYMMQTTVPTFTITLLVFFVTGLLMDVSGGGDVQMFSEGLQRTFVISPWLLLVPLVTGVMIARRWPSLVGSAVFLNITTADQFLSIILTSSMFKDLYAKMGYEPRLLSRSCEDGGTVTSVLIPWNTCGLTQSTVLGVATLTYLPYCFFNLLSPVVSIIVAAIGWKIKRRTASVEA